MARLVTSLCVLAALFALVAVPTMAAPETAPEKKPYIVVLEDSVAHPGHVAKRHAENRGAEVGHVYDTAANGYSAQMSAAEARALAEDPAVAHLEPDLRTHLASIPSPPTPPWLLHTRIFTHQNPALTSGVFNQTFDDQVDVDVAILDSGIDVDGVSTTNPAYDSLIQNELNVVRRVDCYETGSCVEETDPSGDDHGTAIAGILAAQDNNIGITGTAPGARLWGVKTYPDVAPGYKGDAGTIADMIAGLEWVADHNASAANKIEVVNISVVSFGTSSLLEDAISALIEEGVVVVAAAGNQSRNINGKFDGPEKDQYPPTVPASYEDVITVSGVGDWDGLPGAKAKTPPCQTIGVPEGGGFEGAKDDAFAGFSNYGAGIDVAAPSVCMPLIADDTKSLQPERLDYDGDGIIYASGTSGATAFASGAVAILVSMDPPEDAEDVEGIRDTLAGEGNLGWTGDPDGSQEPLIDIGDSAVFDPETVPAPIRGAVDSDVDGNGRADLVTLRANGVAYVHAGGTDAKFGSGTSSFSGSPLNVAQYDGTGHYAIDAADVNGDKRSDLVTVSDDGEIHVFPGSAARTFGGAVDSELDLDPAILGPGGDNPLVVADVTGDGYGDLVGHDDVAAEIRVYPGEEGASFGEGILARTAFSSALHSDSGHHVVDAADVTGDSRADLVTMTSSGDLNVFAGRSDGTFAPAIVSHQGQIDPAMADGSGYEPVGLGDVTKDGKADLVLVKNGTTYTFPGKAYGEGFGAAKASFDGVLTSRTFGSGTFELFGILDVDGNGHADIAGEGADAIAVAGGQSDGSFSGAAVSDGSFPSTQHFKNQSSSGNEFVVEKPAFRRRGCEAHGCYGLGDSVGVWRQGDNSWHLRNWPGYVSSLGHPVSLGFIYGAAGSPQYDVAVSGDWDGDGDDTIGVWRREGSGAFFLLRNSNQAGATEISVGWGVDEAPHYDLPIAGDWNGDGKDTVGVFRSSTGTWFLCNNHSNCAAGFTTVQWQPGTPDDDIPVAGDWDGDGDQTVGIWRGGTGEWFLCDNHAGCPSTSVAKWGSSESPYADLPVAGDWNDDGKDTIGVWRGEGSAWFLCNDTEHCGASFYTVFWGSSSSPYFDFPVVGRWMG